MHVRAGESRKAKGELAAAAHARAQDSALRTPPSAFRRHGISLIEILISMFVLLFGLMGVAAIFPVASHYVQQGEKRERGSGLAQIAFEVIEGRGMLDPETWVYPNYQGQAASGRNKHLLINPDTNKDPNTGQVIGRFNLINTANGPGHAFVIDPLGASSTDQTANFDVFPYLPGEQAATNPWFNVLSETPPVRKVPTGNRFPVRRLNLSTARPNPPTNRFYREPLSKPMAETLFRLRDDLSVELPPQGDHPGIQRWDIDNNNTPVDPTDDTYLARQYQGDYTWLATVVPRSDNGLAALQPAEAAKGELYEVSVAVFYKRDTVPSATIGGSEGSERMIAAAFMGQGQLALYDVNKDKDKLATDLKDIKPGNWIAVMGVNRKTKTFLMKWYRILALDDETSNEYVPVAGNVDVRWAMVTGPDWPEANPANTQGLLSSWDLRVAVLPGIVDVHTRVMSLD